MHIINNSLVSEHESDLCDKNCPNDSLLPKQCLLDFLNNFGAAYVKCEDGGLS